MFRCEVRPALGFESLIETMFALAAAGKTSKKGMPNPFRLAVIAAHFDTVRLPFPPALLQRISLALARRSAGSSATSRPTGRRCLLIRREQPPNQCHTSDPPSAFAAAVIAAPARARRRQASFEGLLSEPLTVRFVD